MVWVSHRAWRLVGDLVEVGEVDPDLAEDRLYRGDAQPVQPVVAVDDAVPPIPAALDRLDAPGTIARLHRALDLRVHPCDGTPWSAGRPNRQLELLSCSSIVEDAMPKAPLAY